MLHIECWIPQYCLQTSMLMETTSLLLSFEVGKFVFFSLSLQLLGCMVVVPLVEVGEGLLCPPLESNPLHLHRQACLDYTPHIESGRFGCCGFGSMVPTVPNSV